MKASGRAWIWAGRLAALLVAVIIPACSKGGSAGTGNANGILWLSPTTSGVSAGGPVYSGTSLWVDPNSGLGGGQIGITQLIQSTDPVTYNHYNTLNAPPPSNSIIWYILGLEHPLETDTSSSAIVQRESLLQGLLNGHRSGGLITDLGLPNAGGGGGGGVGGIGGIGGGVVGNNGSLPGHIRGTLCARAHCKHSAIFHPGPLPGNVPGGHAGGIGDFDIDFGPAFPNAEGDTLLTTLPAPAIAFMDVTSPTTGFNAQSVLAKNPLANTGRLGKIGVSASRVWAEATYSGVQFPEPLDAYTAIVRDNGVTEVLTNWTNCAIGHWRGGTQAFYWDIIWLIFPNPAY